MRYEDLIDEVYSTSTSLIGLSLRFQMECILHLVLWGCAVIGALFGTLITYNESNIFVVFWGAALLYSSYHVCVWLGNSWAHFTGKFSSPEGYARLCAYFNVPAGEPSVDTSPTDPYLDAAHTAARMRQGNATRPHHVTHRHPDHDD